jgi:hypothetical protein
VPIITKSRAVIYIDSKPPALRTKIVTSSRVLGFHPMDNYTNRPRDFENITLIEYFTKYKTDRMTRGRTTAIARDNLGCLIYTNNKITRFTDFHPTYSPEGFFFNTMLQNICFKDEKELLSNKNTTRSYVYKCHIRGLLSNLDILQEYLLKYAYRNLIKTEKRAQLLENLLEEYLYLDPEYVVPDIGPSTNMNVQCQQAKEIRYKDVSHIFDIQISKMTLIQE